MYGSIAAQHAIWNHQHPSSCHDKKFLVYGASGPEHGIGSVLHVAGIALQVALNLNRILVFSPQPAYQWINGDFWQGMDTLDECYFEPLSSCSIFDAFGSMEVTKENLRSIPELNMDSYINNTERVLRSEVVPMGSGLISTLAEETPIMFHDLLKAGNLPKKFFYWWRVQSTTYIVRPNLRTLCELDHRWDIIFDGKSIASGTLSMHVRHGDKWKEGQLATDKMYLEKAERLISQHPRGLHRKIFLSTEDPNTILFFSKVANWTTSWTNVSRNASDPNMSPMTFAERIGWDNEFLNSLLSLQLALECDGFIGQISSNWNRLIDELRSTIRCKYNHFYIDVIQDFNVTNYFW